MIRLLLAAFATYRLSQLIAWDDGPDKVFFNLRTMTKDSAELHGGRWENLDEAVNCPYCLGVWFAAFALLLLKHPTKVGNYFLYWFGIAGMQAFLQGLTKGR